MSELSILQVSAHIIRAGEVLSLWEFDDLVKNETVVPRDAQVAYYCECFSVVHDEIELAAIRENKYVWRKIKAGPYLSIDFPKTVEPPPEHPVVIRLLVDVAIFHGLDFVGISRDPNFSCGLDWERQEMGKEFVLDTDGYKDEVPGGWYHELAEIVFEHAGDSNGCHILTLWQYASGKEPDTWMGPGDYWSEWDMLGQITNEHLGKIAEMIRSKEKGDQDSE